MKEFSLATGWYWLIVIALVSYLIGCFNFAVLISKIKKMNIKDVGSGNPGTMNMTRVFGLKIGLINFICDAFKGGIPVLAVYFIFRNYCFAGTQVVVSDFMRYFAGIFVILGHIYPVTMRFKGGKGIASTLGIFWLSISCENPWFILLTFVFLWIIVLFIGLTEWGSMGSLFGVSTMTIWQAIVFYLRYSAIGALANPYVICTFAFLLALNFLTWYAHRKNIYKLLSGEEHRTSIKRLSKGKKTADKV